MAFLFIGNNIAVDLVNTQIRTTSIWKDSILERDEFQNWLRCAGAFGGEMKHLSSSQRHAFELRRKLKRIFEKVILDDGISDADFEYLNKWSSKLEHKLRCLDSGGIEFVPTIKTSDDALAAIARSACELLGSPTVNALRQCGSLDCNLFFVDTSRSQQRVWCCMKKCGNRSKARCNYARSNNGEI